MEGQVLGGGAIVLVAALLWLAYLLPSWHSRHQFNATERNAVRLSQAIRILAESADQPEEVRVELATRAAHRQAKLAKRAEHERAKLEEVAARAEAERVREEAQFEKERIRASALEARDRRKAEVVAQQTLDRARAEAERARADAEAAAEHERLRAELYEARHDPAAVARRQATARRNVRRAAFVVTVLGLAALAFGITSSQVLIAVAGVLVAVCGIGLLSRMARVARRTVIHVADPVVVEAPRKRVSVLHDEPAPKWTPRSLPAPMTAVAGSRAAAEIDAAEAREALRRAAQEEAVRERAAAAAPVHISTARPAAINADMADADIEAHVRQLLARRAAS